MGIISAVLYFGMIVGAAIQAYRVKKNTPPTWELKLVFTGIVAVFALFRGVRPHYPLTLIPRNYTHFHKDKL